MRRSYHSHMGASAGPKGRGSLKLAWPSLRNAMLCCPSRRATTRSGLSSPLMSAMAKVTVESSGPPNGRLRGSRPCHHRRTGGRGILMAAGGEDDIEVAIAVDVAEADSGGVVAGVVEPAEAIEASPRRDAGFCAAPVRASQTRRPAAAPRSREARLEPQSGASREFHRWNSLDEPCNDPCRPGRRE